MATKSDLFVSVFSTEELEQDQIIFESGIFPLTPFLAYASLKKKFVQGKESILAMATFQKQRAEIKAKALTFKEKAKAEFGIGTKNEHGEEASYKLTKEQLDVMTDIYEKYGDEIVDKIVDFRRDVLAPYTLMKRLIKKNTSISSRDVHGMSREEFDSALESGKKKIELRGKYIGSGQEAFGKMDDIDKKIERLEAAKNKLNSSGIIDDNILEKLYQKFNVQKETFSRYPLSTLDSYVAAMNRSIRSGEKKQAAGFSAAKEINDYAEIRDDPEKALKNKDEDDDTSTERALDIYFGKIKKVIAPHNNFDDALTSYFMRKNIHDEVKKGDKKLYREIYSDIIDGMLHKYRALKKDHMGGVAKNRKGIYFNEIEDKIFKLKVGSPYMSGKLADYDIKLREEDFLERPIYIQKSPELEAAERKADSEIKKFEKELKEILSPEDYLKLKKYRLISNVITVKELKDGNSLFKTSAEIRKDVFSKGDSQEDQVDDEDSDEKIGEEEFVAMLHKVLSKDYTTLRELLADKRKIENMVKALRLNNDDSIVKENKALLDKARARTETKEKDKEDVSGEIVSKSNIEEFVKEILDRHYSSFETLKNDRDKLKEMEKKFNDKNPDDNEKEDVDFLIQKANYKFKRYAFGVEGGE
jgi:hypothetical protein